MAIMSQRIGVTVAQAFGIPTERLMEFDLHFRPSDIVRATCRYAVTDPRGEFEEQVRQFEMVEREPTSQPTDSLPSEERVRYAIERIAAAKRKQLVEDIALIRLGGLFRELDERWRR